MLRYRILTAIILIPLFLLLLFKLTPPAFCMATGIVVLFCAWEWSALMGLTRFYALIYPAILFILLILFVLLPIPIFQFIAAASVWWLFAALLVFCYPTLSDAWGNSKVIRGLMGFLVLIPCWLAINYLRNLGQHADQGVDIVLFLFVLIWGADSGAYFVGKKWGKTKLAPAVSPGKSWQGLLGAIVTCIVITLMALVWSHTPYQQWLWVLLVVMITVIFSVVGDLFESMLKRRENLKDSGKLLPGHGGVLDRIDSLTAAAPIFTMGIWFLGKVVH